MKIGKPVFKAMATMKDGAKPDYISSDCPLGGHHIAQGFERQWPGAPATAASAGQGLGLK